jgi:hypothetical protein
MKHVAYFIIGSALLTAAVLAQAQTQQPPTPGSVWFEQVLGNVEKPGDQTGRKLQQITGNQQLYSFKNGQYTSVLSRISLKLPRIGAEDKVTVREGVPYRRADGEIATTHLVILPDAMAPAPTTDKQAISAVVVTRLRDDRPKDRESVLHRWEPSSQSEREQQHRQGIETTRVVLPRWGEAVQRVISNRASVEPFPYHTRILNSPTVQTVGISRFIVAGQDSFIEFSQIVPCDGRSADDCKAQAIASADQFMDGVVEFLILPPEKKKE